MVTFSYPNNNITGVVDFIKYVNNEFTGGFLGVAWLVIIFGVGFLSTSRYGSTKAMGFAAFLTMVSAILLRFMQMINDVVLFVTVTGFIGILILLVIEDSSVA